MAAGRNVFVEALLRQAAEEHLEARDWHVVECHFPEYARRFAREHEARAEIYERFAERIMNGDL